MHRLVYAFYVIRAVCNATITIEMVHYRWLRIRYRSSYIHYHCENDKRKYGEWNWFLHPFSPIYWIAQNHGKNSRFFKKNVTTAAVLHLLQRISKSSQIDKNRLKFSILRAWAWHSFISLFGLFISSILRSLSAYSIDIFDIRTWCVYHTHHTLIQHRKQNVRHVNYYPTVYYTWPSILPECIQSI